MSPKCPNTVSCLNFSTLLSTQHDLYFTCVYHSFLNSKSSKKTIKSMSKEELEEVRDAVVAHLPVGLGQGIPRVVHQGHVILGDAFQSGQVRVELD